ncbi:competence-specific global transcription modulator [Streptococcus pneumoniae]|nr:competence-specific global transcription modulator [Streptococcus pneumoniae]
MIKELYEEVQGTVYKCRNEYYLHLWELSDWDQEGMLCLHELISREEGLVDDIPRLRKYLKVIFLQLVSALRARWGVVVQFGDDFLVCILIDDV